MHSYRTVSPLEGAAKCATVRPYYIGAAQLHTSSEAAPTGGVGLRPAHIAEAVS